MSHNPPPPAPADAQLPADSAEHEHRYHSYVGSRIPWYVRLIWVLYWVFVVYYTIAYLLPKLQVEIGNPP